MRTLILLILPCAFAQQGPFTMSTNFAADLKGNVEDTRPGCWGYTDAAQWNVTFAPPAGYRVRILKIHGDIVSWIRTLPGDPLTPPESTAGVLLGLQSTPSKPSQRCDVCSDAVRPKRPVEGATMLYLQDSVSEKRPNSRAQYDLPRVNEMLAADHKLLVTVSSWLNTTGKPIHIEPTFTVVYQFEVGQ
jgi:hypothetical protein